MKNDKFINSEVLNGLILDTDNLDKLTDSEAEVVIMCDIAFGDTDEELIKMAKTIKEICKRGKVVSTIPFKEEK